MIVMGITRLHAHEGAPDEDGGAVEEAGDEVAGEEDDVAAFLVDVGG